MKDRTHQVDQTKRLFVATDQTLALCYAKFSPAFFDLILFEEAHRSLFKRFTEVIEYFGVTGRVISPHSSSTGRLAM